MQLLVEKKINILPCKLLYFSYNGNYRLDLMANEPIMLIVYLNFFLILIAIIKFSD